MQSPLFRRSILTLASIVLLAPLVIGGADSSLDGMHNSPVMWISQANVSRRQFFQFVEDFQTQDSILVSWEGCTIDDERLDQFRDALAREDGGHSSVHAEALFHRVVSGRSSVETLQAPPLELSRESAVERLRGSLIGPRDVTGAMAILTARGAIHRGVAIEVIQRVLETDLKLTREQYHLAGTPVMGKAIDDASVHSMVWLTLPSTAVIVLLCCFFLRSWRLILLVLGLGFFGEQLAVAMVHFTGNTMNAVFVVMSPLVFVLAASTGIHLSNYYRDEVSLRGVSGAAERMLRLGWKPCLLSAVTTVAGLLSLLVSEIPAVRLFAMISSGCVLLMTVLMLGSLPGIADGLPLGLNAPSGRAVADRCLEQLATLVVRYRTWICCVCAAVLILAVFGLTRVRTSVEIFRLLDSKNRVVQDHQWFEDHVVALIPVETIVQFDVNGSQSLTERMQIVRDLATRAASIPTTQGTTSALTFLPALSSSSSARSIIRRTLIEQRFERERDSLVALGYLRETEKEQLWRITTRIPALSDVDYATYLDQLTAGHDAVLAENDVAGEGTRVWVTGVVPVVNSAQQLLLKDLMGSFFTALLVIGIVTMFGFRSWTIGVVAMIPNVFPLGILFGALGWLDQPLDIGIMMTASVALGIAVDDTVHFLFFYRHEIDRGLQPTEAVASTLRHCGKAIMQTTIVCGLGLLVFALSDFGPTVRFAWMMFLLLFTALLADLVLLPALLVGPLHSLMHPRGNATCHALRM